MSGAGLLERGGKRVRPGPPRAPFYHRLLRLRRHHPGPVVTFLCFEGSIVGSAVLAFAEVLPWLSVLLVPLAVAGVLKLHDLVVQATPTRAAGGPPTSGLRARAIGIARVLVSNPRAGNSGTDVARGVAPVPRPPR